MKEFTAFMLIIKIVLQGLHNYLKMKYIPIFFLLIISTKAIGQTSPVHDTVSRLPTEFRNKILPESKDGGKLDFWTPIKGHEFDGFLIKKGATQRDNIYASNREGAVVKWASALTKIGIKKNDIISLFEELKRRKIRDSDVTLIDFGISNSNTTN